jgi:hypothetical protein
MMVPYVTEAAAAVRLFCSRSYLLSLGLPSAKIRGFRFEIRFVQAVTIVLPETPPRKRKPYRQYLATLTPPG